MKSSDLFAFVLLFSISVFLIFFSGYLWVSNVGWRGLWLLGVLLTLLTLFIGYLFAKYALSPIVKQNEELDRLLKDTLHELNIPVATIKANVSLLKRKIKEHKELRRLERIESAANQLLELYKEVDYGIKKRIDKAEKEVIDLEEFIKERIEFFSELLKERKIILELSPLKIKVSKHSFTKAFDNLLSNAIKYSTAGSLIQIIVKGDKLMIKDNGEGIEESELIKIFERFYRANEKKEGFGIGLSIVKSCCDEEGIEIRIDSKRGRGTTVALNLKRVKVDDRTS
ncbi:MAG: HAMP domain-containing histidine kinase [Epsilonproteobacteria bacterium]|nr:HAMP domain-containing histidine kinase [Campylobacterota bacterium]